MRHLSTISKSCSIPYSRVYLGVSQHRQISRLKPLALPMEEILIRHKARQLAKEKERDNVLDKSSSTAASAPMHLDRNPYFITHHYLEKGQYPLQEHEDPTNLHTIEICLPRADDGSLNIMKKKLWLIYIHGGAWRDPAITASSFNKTRDLILENKRMADNFAGIASINYRLSPYPEHPTDPSRPDDPARNAKWPDHYLDCCAALAYLQERYHFEDNYILVGHSCGATIATLVADLETKPKACCFPPKAVLGVEGIFDIPLLLNNHKDIPVYRTIVRNAFGEDHFNLPTLSPCGKDWANGGKGLVAAVAHSDDDEMVEMAQAESMIEALKQPKENNYETEGRANIFIGLNGKHDEIWQNGSELCRAIDEVTEALVSRGLKENQGRA